MQSAANEQPGAEARRDPTVAHAHAAISSLLKHAIPPSPPYFTIWYDYHAGANIMVRRVIDTYLSNGKHITEGLLHEIHERFFDTRRESAALMETSQRLRSATEQVMGLVSEASGHSDDYGRSLGAFSGALHGHEGEMAEALQRMIAETQEMARRSAEVGARLEASSRVVVDLQERLEQALRESRTDALTGLPNRRAIEDAGSRLAAESQATGAQLAVAMLDIDRFKAVNDTWGHPVGDAVLRRVAGTLQENAGPGTLCGRFGGEEFIILLPRHDLAGAVQAADRLRVAVGEQTFSVKATGGVLGSVTVSAGVAVLAAGEPLPRLTARADAALYRAKQGGRNRVAWDGAPG